MNRLSGIVRGCSEFAAVLWDSDPESADFMRRRAQQFAAISEACGRRRIRISDRY